jgi:hypothetical protein
MNAEPTPIDFKEKLASIGVMRRTGAVPREQQLDKDRSAYKRLRDEGLQPRTVAGSAELEATMNHRFEAEVGHVFPHDRFPDRKALISRVEDGLEQGRQMEEFRQQVEAEKSDG